MLKIIPGVPAFFFISGLLVCAAYERTRQLGNFVFFKNRMLRIYPALWVCVAVSSSVVLISGYLSTQKFSISHFIFWVFGQATIFQFYNPEFMRSFGVGVLNGALWTIAVELQFYILTPLLYFLLVRCRGWLALIFVLSLTLNVYFIFYLDWSLLYVKVIYASFVPWLYMYVCGFLVAYYREYLFLVAEQVKLRWIVCGYVFSMLFLGSYVTNAANSINPISFVLLAACLIKLSTIKLPTQNRLLVFIAQNDFSYGIYLYHMPILNFLLFFGWFSVIENLFLAYLSVICVAIISWFLIEKPVLKYKQ